MCKVALPVLEVSVGRPDLARKIKTLALLDPGSDRSFCTRRLISQLGISGVEVEVSLETLSKVDKQEALEVELSINGTSAKNRSRLPIMLKVLAIERLPSLQDNTATSAETGEWNHLQGIELPTPNSNVDLLIGQDVPQALIPLEVRAGADGEPYAVRTLLGWTVSGPLNHQPGFAACVSCLFNVTPSIETRLEAQIRKFWEIDTGDVVKKSAEMSVEDKSVLELWSSCGVKELGHYQLNIPFRSEPPGLPNNRFVAERRLMSLGKRLAKDPVLYERYNEEITKLLSNRYAERVNEQEINEDDGRTWYLPHHPVINPRKPEKIRIVFDCAAEYAGTSLNKQVLQGPVLTNKLLGVLVRFRQGQVAIMADIEAMFHQVGVPLQQRDALRFLWWSGDASKPLSTFRMKVHLFGGVWSPACATYALQRTLQDHSNVYQATSKKITRSFYVDDLLCSVDTVESAARLAQDSVNLLACGGFRLTKWASNSKDVLGTIPKEERNAVVKELNLNFEHLPVDSVLGVMWDMENDQFSVKTQIQQKPETRRGLLSVVSSVYDPLGFLCPFVLRGKILFQEECRRKRGWDEALSPETKISWYKWLEELPAFEQFRISRCFVPQGFGGVKYCELHHFCDASQVAYGTVSYLRFVSDLGVHCSYVFGKSRLAPLKTLTIPRLELSAAVLAVQSDVMLRDELDLVPIRSVFWTDSVLTLQYITSTSRRFHTFVANRVATIHNASEPSQWRYVDTLRNPADDATRGLTAAELVKDGRWTLGPEFLWEDEIYWPETPNSVSYLPVDNPEVKRDLCAKPSVIHSTVNSSTKLLQRYSDWHQLCKGVAWIRRFIHWIKDRRGLSSTCDKGDLSVTEIRNSRLAILRFIQNMVFETEIAVLRSGGRMVPKQSSVHHLEPYLDERSVLRVNGRLQHAPIAAESKCPILLPRDHPVTELLVRDVHKIQAGHSGREHTISVLRQKYWIPKCRPLVDRVIKKCITCRKVNEQPGNQRFAPLPEDRVTPGKPPFYYTGIDCFGPIYVKQGRSRIKRYGCLFTCLSTRAIHLEVLGALDSDAFLNALTRFSARRGFPGRIRSDNGTNFVGALKELRQVVKTWNNDERIRGYMLRKDVEWVFNPPGASHMGGVWERQIRTVRKVLMAVVGSQVLDDERLGTLFCEVEAIVNGRPITPTSEDVCDLKALSPSHLLLPSCGPALPLGGISETEIYRRRWKHAQFLADQFWKRWVKEYLPLLRQRQRNIKPSRNFAVGDLVLLTEDNMPRNHWNLGRVTEIFPSTDGIVRTVNVKTQRNILRRPITKICLLEAAGTEQ